MKSDTVRPSVCPAGESPKSGRKRDGRNTSEGVWKRLGLPRPTPKHRQGFSPLGYVARCVGGKEAFMNLARLSSEPLVKGIVSRRDSLSQSDRRYVSLEDLCEACGIEPATLFGAVVSAGYTEGYDISPLLCACFGYL